MKTKNILLALGSLGAVAAFYFGRRKQDVSAPVASLSSSPSGVSSFIGGAASSILPAVGFTSSGYNPQVYRSDGQLRPGQSPVVASGLSSVQVELDGVQFTVYKGMSNDLLDFYNLVCKQVTALYNHLRSIGSGSSPETPMGQRAFFQTLALDIKDKQGYRFENNFVKMLFSDYSETEKAVPYTPDFVPGTKYAFGRHSLIQRVYDFVEQKESQL